jgi:hypothetical protein
VESNHRHRSVPQLIFGLIICTIGVLWTLDSMGIADAEYYIRYWPGALIILGAAKVWQARGGGGSLGGVVLILIGTALLSEHLLPVNIDIFDFWPMFLVFLGASLVWRSIVGRRAPASDGNTTISAVAVLGGVNRGNNSGAFRGGDLTAVMGGCEVDLRQARIDGEAVIDVFAMWGGIDIRVPEDWTVIGRVTPLLGGFDDKTRPPQTASAHRLVVRGFVIMGGVEVKH